MSTEIAPVPRIDPAAVNGPLAVVTAKERPQSLAQDMLLLAQHMAVDSFMPFHLCGLRAPEARVANCLRVIQQARYWGMDPYAVAANSYVMEGRLEYYGKLVLAVLIKSGVLKGRPVQTFTGEGMDLSCTVTACLKGEKEPRTKTLTRRTWQNKNELWGKDPEAKLLYITIKAWANQNCPEIFLGMGGNEDLEFVAAEVTDIQPERTVDHEGEATTGGEIEHAESTPASDAGPNQTLQEALAATQSAMSAARALDPDALLDFQLMSSLIAAFDEYFVAVGVGNSPEGLKTKDELRSMLFQRHGATTMRALTNRAGQDILAKLTAKTDAARAAKAEAAQKH